jgi:hypothetical protein
VDGSILNEVTPRRGANYGLLPQSHASPASGAALSWSRRAPARHEAVHECGEALPVVALQVMSHFVDDDVLEADTPKNT